MIQRHFHNAAGASVKYVPVQNMLECWGQENTSYESLLMYEIMRYRKIIHDEVMKLIIFL